ncbi:MAG TPA: proton extrusion protein PcxA [Leptolyngbyaceae cyanobacterium M33_DOE_097]|uniref:Proton extrusion protein PxcA n=1 Tax=Oscillatoriales cyanobacterium SpSt-418 TaxID=2282169 RepID=A0A7C3KEC4_9CYAN|nr:proton extrusion protein PcxA [Leptolyngbyaceae cyanobacterium M33_DOE_097]
MNGSFFPGINRFLQKTRRWYEDTPERALEQAYDAALMIQAIEDEHFEGRKIVASNRLSDNTNAYFQAELKKYLKIANIRLSEFRASRSILNVLDGSADVRSGNFSLSDREKSAVVLEKLKFIDATLERYQIQSNESVSLVPIAQTNQTNNIRQSANRPVSKKPGKVDLQQLENLSESDLETKDADGIMDKTGVLPRSILNTLDRIKRDLDPTAEQQVIQSYRTTKAKTLISIRFLILLIIIPLLTQQLSKIFVVGPIVEFFRKPESSAIFLNFELEEEALRELQLYRERLEFDLLLGRVSPEVIRAPRLESEPRKLESEPHKLESESHSSTKKAGDATLVYSRQTELNRSLTAQAIPEEKATTPLTPEEREAYIERQVRERANELGRDYQRRGTNAIKNVFADIFSVVAFGLVIATNRREVAVLKSFIDETVYGLSDSAKAFIIILFTDIFVGFHSPHGWEVLLESISRHFGLPANRDFIFLFIATFPVILDTIFKYWIFRYLNRVSPSAVATYRNMNES